MAKKKQGATTFEGGEGATASVTVNPKKKPAPRKAGKSDPALRQKKKRPNSDFSWTGYKKK